MEFNKLTGIHAAPLLTYMKLSGVKTSLLINFHVTSCRLESNDPSSDLFLRAFRVLRGFIFMGFCRGNRGLEWSR
jgi:hypothetical protein